ncbi:hypothetical protein CMV_026151, partial [Castanea mollissima]
GASIILSFTPQIVNKEEYILFIGSLTLCCSGGRTRDKIDWIYVKRDGQEYESEPEYYVEDFDEDDDQNEESNEDEVDEEEDDKALYDKKEDDEAEHL